MTTQEVKESLIYEVRKLNKEYTDNFLSIEQNNQEALKKKKEKREELRQQMFKLTTQEALAEVVKNVEETIKRVAKYGRKVKDTYLPRTECCIYKWNLETVDEMNKDNMDKDCTNDDYQFLMTRKNRFQGMSILLTNIEKSGENCDSIEVFSLIQPNFQIWKAPSILNKFFFNNLISNCWFFTNKHFHFINQFFELIFSFRGRNHANAGFTFFQEILWFL